MTQRKASTKKTVKRTLRRVTPVEAQEIVSELTGEVEEKVQESQTREPGKTVNGAKITYTYNDLVRMFPIVAFTPEKSIPLTFQGVQVTAFAGYEMHVPKCFKDIYDRHMRERRAALDEVRALGITIDAGAGALPPQ